MRPGMRSPCVVVLVAALGGCGEADPPPRQTQGAEAASSGAATPGMPTATSPAATGAAPTAAAADAVETTPATRPADDELYVDGFYRSAEARAIFLMPPAIADDGVVKTQAAGALRLVLGKSRDGKLSVIATVLPPGDFGTPRAAAAVRKEFAGLAAASGMALDELPVRTVNGDGPGGKVFGFRHGPDARGVVATMGLVVDGRDAIMIGVIGETRAADEATAYVLERTRVGRTVPRLTDRAPARRLAGTYATDFAARDATLRARWLTLDRRGYAHADAPEDALALDVEASVQAAALGARAAFTYDVAGGALVLTPVGARGAVARHALGGDDAALTLDGDVYHRLDGAIADGATFDGAWEWYSGSWTSSAGSQYGATSRRTVTFGAGHAVGFTGGTAITGTSVDSVGLIDSTLASYADAGTWRGSYRVAGDRLRVTTREGVPLTFALHAAYGRGQRSSSVIMIGGRAYVRQDD